MLQKAGINEPKLSVCGLNPHAGDGGNIGREEIETIAPAIEPPDWPATRATGPGRPTPSSCVPKKAESMVS